MTYYSPQHSASIATALCSDSAQPSEHDLAVALNFELPMDGSVPEWIQLIPAGPRVEGRDGRFWFIHQPQTVIDASFDQHAEIVGDWEHATELKGPSGDEAPAAFWMKEMEVRDGSIWARVEWTPRARAQVANKEYRFISPVFAYIKEGRPDAREILYITSASLTNNANFDMKALNRAQPSATSSQSQTTQETTTEDNTMSLAAAIRKALELKEDATEESAVAAINTLKSDKASALNRAETPSMEKFIPRADYDQAQQRAMNAEQKLADYEKSKQDSEIDSLVGDAIKAGKITPASKDFYVAACRQEKGIEQFKSFISSAPVIADQSNLDTKDPNSNSPLASAMNTEEKQISDIFGNSADDLKKYQ